MIKAYGLISGNIASGKTKALNEFIKILTKKGIPHYGFTELCIHQDGKRVGYDMLTNMNGKEERIPFVRLRKKILNDGMIFSFDLKAVNKIERIFKSISYPKEPSILIFDEYGKQESKLKGQWPNIYYLINYYQTQKIPFYPIFSSRKQNVPALSRSLQKNFGITKNDCLMNLPCSSKTVHDCFENFISKYNKLKNFS